ncbi:hypothetical protein BU15DRAFT_67949 [Melanogaster broomeanus]|nr:hypothetical protein BU15DRAFT_67949 [Melanogaster broomeanus]
MTYSSIPLCVIQSTVQSVFRHRSSSRLAVEGYKPSTAQSVTVGVVGFPSVGKGSLVNSLKRSKVSMPLVGTMMINTTMFVLGRLAQLRHSTDTPRIFRPSNSSAASRSQTHLETSLMEDEDESSVSRRQKGSIVHRNVVKVEEFLLLLDYPVHRTLAHGPVQEVTMEEDTMGQEPEMRVVKDMPARIPQKSPAREPHIAQAKGVEARRRAGEWGRDKPEVPGANVGHGN